MSTPSLTPSALPASAPEPADCEAYDDESMCPECLGDGGDKWNDYCLPCPMCGGAGRLW